MIDLCILLISLNTAHLLADYLHHLIASTELRAELRHRGLAHVQAHYTQERIAQQTVEFYRQVLA
jgi:glycosyltransferase involved in cell wall biosynthesis